MAELHWTMLLLLLVVLCLLEREQREKRVLSAAKDLPALDTAKTLRRRSRQPALPAYIETDE